MSLSAATGHRQKTRRATVPHLRWVNGEPFVLPGQPDRKRIVPLFSPRVWLIGLAAAASAVVVGYWTLSAGGTPTPSGNRQSQSGIQWVAVARAPVPSQSAASGTASAARAPAAAAPAGSGLSNPDGTTTAEPEEVAATLTEAALSEMLKARFEGRTVEGTPRGAVTIQDVRARLQKPEIVTEANIKAGFLTLPVSFSATVAVHDGRSLTTVQTAKLATTAAPEEIRARLERFAQRFTDEILLAEQVRLTSLTVSDVELSGTGVRIPGRD